MIALTANIIAGLYINNKLTSNQLQLQQCSGTKLP